mgnify:CR=1 FL=1
MGRFLFLNVDQIGHVIADRPLPVFIERGREPDCAAVGQRTEAGVDVVKARIDQTDRNDGAVENLADGPVRTHIGEDCVTAKKSSASAEGVAFASEQ